MAISFVGAGAQAVSTTSGNTVTGAWPTGYTAIANDIAFLVVAGRHNNTTSLAPSTPSGYTQLATEFSEAGTYDLQLTVFYKVLAGGESAPSTTVPAAYSTNSGGMSCQTLVYSGVDTTTPIDASAVVSDSAGATAATFTPTGVTTASANAMVVSFASTSDDNAINLSSAQGFTLRISGANYDTTIGGDHSVGVADCIIATASTPTMPTWNQSVNGPDYWAAITVSLKSGVTTVARTATSSATGTSTATVPPVSFTDDFTRADSTTSIGGNWIVRAGTLGITSNQGYPVAATATATQPIQSSEFKQVVRAKIVADPAVNSPVNVLIAWKDSNNYIAAVRSQPFATWVLVSVVGGVTTNHGNTGLSATTNVWVHVVRNGTSFQISAQSTTAGANQTRSSTFTITGFDYNDVGILFPSSGTAYTVDDFTARPVVTTARTGTAAGTGTSTAIRLITDLRTASSSGTGTSTATGVVTRFRTATSSGTGTSTATGLVTPVVARTATSTGTGTSTASRLITRLRTATATAIGTSTAVAASVRLRTATSTGTGASTATRTVTKLRTGSATGQGTSTVTGTATAVVTRTASATGTGTSTAVGAAQAAIQRTATSSGTGTATADGATNPAIQRTATAAGTGTSAAAGTVFRRRTATSAGTGAATGTGQPTPEIQRQATAAGISTETVVSIGLPRPLNPPRTPRQALRRSQQTTVVAEAPKLVVPQVLDIQPVQPTLVFNWEEDDETMLCLA